MGTSGKVSQIGKEQARAQIVELVQKYQSLTVSGKDKYNEENTKKDFIQPLFEALGWDMANAEEVWAEHPAGRGPVDYAFRIGGVARFYLEAKPLKRDLANPDWVKQAISYAYNKGIPWVVLTNFKELWVFTGDQKEQRFITLRAEEYIEELERLWLLSKESIATEGLGEEARKVGVIPPAISVEKRLYSQLRQWREKLISQVHKYHTEQPLPVVDEIVQRLFNRLIFIRTCEDRGFEEKKLLAAVHQFKSGKLRRPLLKELRRIFREFDGIYDSDLFKTHLLDEIHIEDPLLRDIIQGLYQIPGGVVSYDFSVIDADVLGAVYEQYLGHVAEIAKQRQREAQRRMDLGLPEEVQFELTAKREKRKGQGIYYTPKWVVDYIVKQTVGRFIEEHIERPDAIHEMTILDPACGSGSFLIKAYDALLRYHADSSDRLEAHIFSDERTAILKKNIFGVDLDPQAVEIARLNLLIRGLAQRELLPFLDQNIRRGNSLISGEPEALRKWFGDEWEKKHPFDWGRAFPEVMANGGFDVVIGNPPYAGFHGFEEEKPYYRSTFRSTKGRFDLYIPFIEKGLDLLKPGGLFGFICPSNFMKRQHGMELRRLLRKESEILEIVDFEHQRIFQEALNYTCILILMKRAPSKTHHILYRPGKLREAPWKTVQSDLSERGWVFLQANAHSIIQKTRSKHTMELGGLVEGIFEGVVTGRNDVFVVPSNVSRALGLERAWLRPVIQGRGVGRYYLSDLDKVLIYPYRDEAGKSKVLSDEELQCEAPKIYSYLSGCRHKLSGRGYFQKSSKLWYELWNERSFSKQGVDKLVVRELGMRGTFAPSSSDEFYLDTVCGIVPKAHDPLDMKYILALLNATLLDFHYQKTTVPKANGFFIYKTMFLRYLPIRTIDFSSKTDNDFYSAIVRKVERMLELQERMGPIRDVATSAREELQQLIDQVDREIDSLVYDLYGLTKAERKLVEEGVGKK